MRGWKVRAWALAVGGVLGVGCGDSGGGGAGGDGGSSGTGSDGSGCTSLCKSAGFDSGDEMNFGGGVIECVCAGAGQGLAQTECASYCAGFKVDAKAAYLSQNTAPNDKCVCDGTQATGTNGGNTGGSSGASTGGTSTSGSTGGDTADIKLDANGFPILPSSPLPDSTGLIAVSVTGSSSAHLTNGVYQAPHSKNASSQSSVTFIPAGLAITSMPSLQVQMKVPRMQQSGTFTCNGVTDVLVRYGMPPSGNQQLLTLDCSMDYTYEASTKTYAGTLTASMADGLTEPNEAMKADLKARFSFIEE